jgi:hypothetical protein
LARVKRGYVGGPLPVANTGAQKLVEIANAVESVRDGRIHIEKINGPMLYQEKATPAELASIARSKRAGWSCMKAARS